MPYREIIVYLDPSHDCGNRLKVAVDMAATHGARLIGVDASTQAARELTRIEQVEALPEIFESAIKQAGVRGVLRARHTPHYADLIIASQPEFEARDLVIPEVPEDVLLTAGVPLLLFPYGWIPRPVGESIVIAWKASREATRAVHDAMPLLQKAKKVTVFTYAPGSGGLGTEPELLVAHLREHGVAAKPSSFPDLGDSTPVDALFASLDTLEADLIVAGAYGHSRWAEALFGGVSHTLVRQPSMPVLLSH